MSASNSTITDESLMLDFQRGSREAFEELFARYRGPIYGFFRRRIPLEHRADDLTQETFLAVIKAIDHYQPLSLVRTYLYGIAMNLLFAERRKKLNDSLELKDAIESASADVSDDVLWLRQALAKLDDSEREILMLREYEQLAYIEIAELLKMPVNTVRSRLFRARSALKDLLDPQCTPQVTPPHPASPRPVLARVEGEAL